MILLLASVPFKIINDSNILYMLWHVLWAHMPQA
jgi:hypothetical protein